MGCTNSRA
jgi:hypothetical protein